jgi:hypothetical protein
MATVKTGCATAGTNIIFCATQHAVFKGDNGFKAMRSFRRHLLAAGGFLASYDGVHERSGRGVCFEVDVLSAADRKEAFRILGEQFKAWAPVYRELGAESQQRADYNAYCAKHGIFA